MPAPIFAQVSSTRVYASSARAEAGVAGYWAGYWPSIGSAFGARITLDETWRDPGGVYLFCGRTPDDFSAFAATLARVLPALSPDGRLRALWLADPNAPDGNWQWQALNAVASSSGATIAWRVARQALFTLGRYTFAIEAGAVLTQADAVAQGYGIAIAAGDVSFLAPDGGWSALPDSSWLPFAGGALGTLITRVALTHGNDTLDDFARLGVMLRYATPDTEVARDDVLALSLPVLSQRGATLTVQVGFDPLFPLLPARSGIAFFAGGIASPPALRSAFVTTRGFATTLTPLAAIAPLWPAQLAFCHTPLTVVSVVDSGYYDYHLAPHGAFALAVLTAQDDDASRAINPPAPCRLSNGLMLGLSGIEYADLGDAGTAVMLFRAGEPAFAPLPDPDSANPPTAADALTALATTAHLTVLPASAGATGLGYFAQPQQAPLHVAGTCLGTGFLEFHEMRAARLDSYGPATPAPRTFPAGCYGALPPAAIPLARAFEAATLAPARRFAIETVQQGLLRAYELDDPRLAVTPQGLVAVLSPDESQWAGVVIGNMPASTHKRVELTAVGSDLQAALQSNQLFFVVSNVDTFMDASSVAYQLTARGLDRLATMGVPTLVVAALRTHFGALSPPYKSFDTEDLFDAEVAQVAGTAPYLAKIRDVAGLLLTDIDGWTFQLSPRSWRTAADSATVMLFKYCNRKLVELVADGSAWGWPEAATGDPRLGIGPTQKQILTLFTAAATAPVDSPYRHFYDDIVANENWNGVLFLNAPVAPAGLPDDLLFLSAGIDQTRFYAHHVGFSLTPFDVTTQVNLHQTAVFALIDYQDPVDLYAQKTVPFAFKTTALTARFANAALAGFSAQAQLLLNRLFGSELTRVNTSHGNNLLLSGSYQRANGAPAYAFTLVGENRYGILGSALESVEVLVMQLQTSKVAGTGGEVRTDFTLSGNLRFNEFIPFDVFSFGDAPAPVGGVPYDGYLRYNTLTVAMRFDPVSPQVQHFTVAENRLAFDLRNSNARTQSLAAHFPLTLSGFVAQPEDGATTASPPDLGYEPVSAPLEQVPLAPPWYGLVFTLDLGTLGELAGSVGLTINVLAAWAPGELDGERPVFVGIQLPSAGSLGFQWPLQGVMRLGFRGFRFETYVANGARGYLLRLRRFALSILGWSFPPGNADVYLFGNPRNAQDVKLGWYGAYSTKPKDDDPNKVDEQRRLPALPSELPSTPDAPPLSRERGASTRAQRRRLSGRRGPPPGGGR